jgi:hypothetical protein
MDILILRLIHIGAGAFWVGAVYMFFLYVQPTAAALGPDATRFMFHLLHHARLPVVILGSAVVAVIAGIWLLWITSSGLDPELLFNITRLGYTVGGIAAILTLAVGGLYVFPRTRTVERVLGGVLDEARPPTPDEQVLLARTARESRWAGWVVLVGLAIAVVSMATARYWSVVLG